MNDEKHGTRADRSKGDPTFLLACRFVALGQGVQIIEDKGRRLEAKSMFE